MSFRLSIVQQPLAWQDAAANRAHFASVLAPLAGNTDLVILPEMFTTGFTMRPQEHAEPAAGETRAWLLEQARRSFERRPARLQTPRSRARALTTTSAGRSLPRATSTATASAT